MGTKRNLLARASWWVWLCAWLALSLSVACVDPPENSDSEMAQPEGLAPPAADSAATPGPQGLQPGGANSEGAGSMGIAPPSSAEAEAGGTRTSASESGVTANSSTSNQASSGSGGSQGGAPASPPQAGAGVGGADATSTETSGADTRSTEVSSGGNAGNSGPASERLVMRPLGSTEAELGYWEYLPPESEAPMPLLVFTHGAAWTGDGDETSLQRLLEVGPPNLISTDTWPSQRPFIVLAPQNPGPGCFSAAAIDGFLRHAVKAYQVDPRRVYLTGQSCGAIGAWNYLAEHQDEFVNAAVLIAGDGNDAWNTAGCALGKVAIWGLHNEQDPTIAASGTSNPIQALLDCEPTPDARLTIYPGATEHDAWTKTYDSSSGNDIYAWLLEHVRP